MPCLRPKNTFTNVARLIRRTLVTLCLISLSNFAHARCEPKAFAHISHEHLPNHLKSLAKQCQHSADFLILYGTLLNQTTQFQEAATVLERALFFAPERLDAQIQYAYSLGNLGDNHAAQALLRPILTRNDLPKDIAHTVQSIYDALQAKWQLSARLSSHLAIDSNLAQMPSSRTIWLTFPLGRLPFRLNSPAPAHHTLSQLNQAHVQLTKSFTAEHSAQLFANIRHRLVPNHAYLTNYYWEAGANWLYTPRTRQTLQVSAHTSSFDYLHHSILRTRKISFSYQWHNDFCTPQLQTDFEQRHFPNAETLNGNNYAIQLITHCQFDEMHLSSAWRWSKDFAQHATRSGGNYVQKEWRTMMHLPIKKGTLELETAFSLQNDSRHYHALLEHGDARRIQRSFVKLEYAHPISNAWTWKIGVEWTKQRANLPLFSYQNYGVQTGVSYDW